MNKLIIDILILIASLLPFGVKASSIFAFPSNMTDSFRHEVYSIIKDRVQVLPEGDDIYLISDQEAKLCSMKGAGNKRKNLSRFRHMDCRDTINILMHRKNDGIDMIDVPKVVDSIIGNLSKDTKFDLYIFGSPLYLNEKSNLDFSRGYSSLGYLDINKSRFVSPFISNYEQGFISQPVAHFIYPNGDEFRYVSRAEQGNKLHYDCLRYFWNSYFNSLGIEMNSYNSISEGIPNRAIFIAPDLEYDKSKKSLYFIDLMVANSKNKFQKGDKEILISKKNAINGDTLKVYNYSLSKPGVVDTIFLREGDADSDTHPGKIKLLLVYSDGTAETFLLTPSKDGEWLSHTIKSTSFKDAVSLSFYPIDSHGKFNNFNGVWAISNLEVTFR